MLFLIYGLRSKQNAAVHAGEENPVIGPDATLRDVAFAVCTALDRLGVHAVLCGGSAATVYAPEAYQSEDLDFVLSFGMEDASAVRDAVTSLGYTFKNGMFFHAASRFTVEFPRGPLAIGTARIVATETIRDGDLVLHILSATDAVTDRLNKYAAWDDFSALHAAVAVATATPIHLDAVRDFMRREGAATGFTRQYSEAWAVFERRVAEQH
ncbi:MAG TPA: hypothetical protein VGN14_18705 [Candidatus Elarobacter sp.]|jgi:hypothetical protein